MFLLRTKITWACSGDQEIKTNRWFINIGKKIIFNYVKTEVRKINLIQGLNTYNKCLLRTSSSKQLLTLGQTFYNYDFRDFFCFTWNKILFLPIFYYLCTKPVVVFFLIKTESHKKGQVSTHLKKKKKTIDISKNEENLKLTAFLQELTEFIRISNYLAVSWQAMLFS